MSGVRVLQSGIHDVVFGRDVTVVEPCNLYKCSIGDGCFIGPFTEVQSGVTIGARTRIQSHSFVCELVTIGQDCVVAHGVMFINDLLRVGPARGDRTHWRGTTIGNNVSIGSNATLLPIRVCDDVVIGAGAVVVSDVTAPGHYVGNPASKLEA